MDDGTVARALHVIFVVLWIGGVAFVTTVLLPAIRRLKAPRERIQLFADRAARPHRGLVSATFAFYPIAWAVSGVTRRNA
jgi:uncharacterized membrane protein